MRDTKGKAHMQKTYTCKKTGKKFTEQEVMERRQARAKRQLRAQIFKGIIFIFIVMMGSKIVTEQKISMFEAEYASMQTVEIRLMPGQTVWTIAKELTPEHRTADVLYAMRSVNEGINFEEAKAYQDVVTFFVDGSIDLTTLTHLNFE